MSIQHCEKCNRGIDTDFEAEHFDEHSEVEEWETPNFINNFQDYFGVELIGRKQTHINYSKKLFN